jgi:hypothetical protein
VRSALIPVTSGHSPVLTGGGVSDARPQGFRQKPVGFPPGNPGFQSELRSQRPGEGPQKCFADGVVMTFPDMMDGVATPELTNNRSESVEVIESIHCEPDHLHELRSLLGEVAPKKFAERRIQFEKARVKETGGLFRNGGQLLEGSSDQRNLSGGHDGVWRKNGDSTMGQSAKRLNAVRFTLADSPGNFPLWKKSS